LSWGTFLRMVLIFYGGYAHVVIASFAGENHDRCRSLNSILYYTELYTLFIEFSDAGKRNKLGMIIALLGNRFKWTKLGMIKIWASHIHATCVVCKHTQVYSDTLQQQSVPLTWRPVFILSSMTSLHLMYGQGRKHAPRRFLRWMSHPTSTIAVYKNVMLRLLLYMYSDAGRTSVFSTYSIV